MNESLKPAEHSLPKPVPHLVDLHRDREAGEGLQSLICIDRNERMSPFPDWFIDKIRSSIDGSFFSRYPVTDSLYRRLSEHLDVPREQLLLTPGSDGAMKALFHTYVRPGDGVVMLEPSYAMLKVYSKMFQAKPELIEFDEHMGIDVERLLSSIVPGVRLAVIVNPNQPTGTLLDQGVLTELAGRAARAGTLLVVDEAYYPFSRTTMMPMVPDTPHLAVTRTFSKAAGLAGLRVGYIAAHREVVSNLFKVRSTYDVNSMALLVACHVLANPGITDDYVKEVSASAELLAEGAHKLGLTPLPTSTNFMLIKVAHRCAPVWLIERLREHGFLVKGPFSAPCLAECIRVTLGPQEIIRSLVDKMRLILS